MLLILVLVPAAEAVVKEGLNVQFWADLSSGIQLVDDFHHKTACSPKHHIGKARHVCLLGSDSRLVRGYAPGLEHAADYYICDPHRDNPIIWHSNQPARWRTATA